MNASSDLWYYVKQGEKIGPVSLPELQRLASENQIDSDTLLWKDGLDDWIRAIQVRGLLSDSTSDGGQSSSLVDAYAPPDSPSGGYGTRYPSPPRQNTLAILSFVFSLLSLGSVCCCFLLYVPLAISAVIMGVLGMQQARKQDNSGYGLALAGLIIGSLVLAMFTLFLALGLTANIMQVPQQLP